MPFMINNILKNLFSKPATRAYPFVVRKAWPGTRGGVGWDMSKCIMCGLCQKICPAVAIDVRGKKDDPDAEIEYNPFACIRCFQCVEKCPVKAIYTQEEHDAPGAEKENRIYRRRDVVKEANEG